MMNGLVVRKRGTAAMETRPIALVPGTVEHQQPRRQQYYHPLISPARWTLVVQCSGARMMQPPPAFMHSVYAI